MKQNISEHFFNNIEECIIDTLCIKDGYVPDDYYQNFVDRICYYKFPRTFDPYDTLLESFKYYFTDISKRIKIRERNIPFNDLCGKDVNVHDFYKNDVYFYKALSKNNNVIEFFRTFYHRYLLNAVYRYCRSKNIIDSFYQHYMKDYIRLANSNNFLNHSSCDAVILPLESAIHNLFKDRVVFDHLLDNICEFIKVDSSDVYLLDNYDYKRSKIKLSILLKSWDICNDTEDRLTDTLFKDMTINALVSVLVCGIVHSFKKSNIINDKTLRLLSADINLFFTRYTTNILTNIAILKEFASLKEEYMNHWGILVNTYRPNRNELWNFYNTSIKICNDLTPVSEYFFSCVSRDKNVETVNKLIKTVKETNDRIFVDKNNGKYINGVDFIESFNEDEKFKNKISDKVYYENNIILFNQVADEAKKLIVIAHNKLNFNITDWIFEQIGERLKARKGNSFLIPSFFYEYYHNKSFYM